MEIKSLYGMCYAGRSKIGKGENHGFSSNGLALVGVGHGVDGDGNFPAQFHHLLVWVGCVYPGNSALAVSANEPQHASVHLGCGFLWLYFSMV